MVSKTFVLFGFFVFLVIMSEVAAKTSEAYNDVKDVAVGGGGGYPGGGGGGGGYPGGGGGHPGGGSYCHFGCCGRRGYDGYCLRCCGMAEAAHAQVEVKPHNAAYNDVKDVAAGGGGGYSGGGGGGGYPGGGSYCHFGCCGRRGYDGYCLRCCGMAEAAAAQVEVEQHN